MCATPVSDDPERSLSEHEIAVYVGLRGFRLFRADRVPRSVGRWVIARTLDAPSDWTYVTDPIGLAGLSDRCDVAAPTYWDQMEKMLGMGRLIEVHP